MRGGRWRWDETLYAGSAEYYAMGRVPYPSRTPEVLAEALGLDGRGRLLDIGCGPGSLTLLLAPLFEEAVGIDADPDMIRQAEAAGATNIRWYRMRAEELPAALGTFRVVTFAQSFHWLERPRVARTVKQMLEPGGVCINVHATTHEGVPGDDPLPHPRPPRAEIAALVRRYLGPVRRAGRGALPAGTPSGEDQVLRDAGFAGPTRLEIEAGIAERTEDQVVASVFSLSSSTPHLFGERRGEFERELRALLRRVSPDGYFCERMREVALDIWRPEPPVRHG
ncbi:MAG: class I SAM-dependent methyltransferase [Micromonosporaceae bacterium]|jgi:SAM-dependent methyltransferase|nr:class I SAM-dependent methyltransferase [Micromonosporaceae bacterium]